MPQPGAPAPFRTVSLALTGSGGSGVMTAGQMLLQAAARAGLHGIMGRSMGPQIRGGEAAAFLRISESEVLCPSDRFDVMVAFDWLSTERFAAELALRPISIVLCDRVDGKPPAMVTGSGARRVDVSFKEILADIPGGRPNMVGLGACAALIGLPIDHVVAVVRKSLKRKGDAAIEASVAGVRAGVEAVADLDDRFHLRPPAKKRPCWNISGNEAVGLGALRGGVRFVAAYPITPATEVLEWLAPNLEHLGGELVQAEDELASINMAIGGSFGGVPTLTATSGPGLALMIEALGLSVASETPVVVIDVQRGGPSTGIPTKSEQSDLNIAVYGLHGDAPHIVTGTTSVADCAFTTQWSTYLAEKLQTPAIVLTDQSLGQTRAVVDPIPDAGFLGGRELAEPVPGEFRRYAITESGISPTSIPGMPGGEYVADGLEHTSLGRPSSQAEDHQMQLDKRLRKLEEFDYGPYWADIYGEGDVAMITWGSSTGPAREALRRAQLEGRNFRVIALRLLSPTLPERFAEAIAGVEKALVVEQTHGRQFHKYLRAHFDLPVEVRVFNKPGPLQIKAGHILDSIADWI